MKAVAETLGVARSSLAERQAKSARPRGPYRKPEDEALLPTIREIVDARPSYALSPDHRTREPRAALARQAGRQRQARAQDHARKRAASGARQPSRCVHNSQE